MNDSKQQLNKEYLKFHTDLIKKSMQDGVGALLKLKEIIGEKQGLIGSLLKEKEILENNVPIDKIEKEKNEKAVEKVEKAIFVLKKIYFNSNEDEFSEGRFTHLELNRTKYENYKDSVLNIGSPLVFPGYSVYLMPVLDSINTIILLIEKIQYSLKLKAHFEKSLSGVS